MGNIKKNDNYFNDLLLLWISRYDYQYLWRLASHNHNFYQLIYCIDGKAKANYNNEIIELLPHTLLLIKPNVEHSIDEIDSNGLKTLDLKFVVKNEQLSSKLLNLPNFFKINDEEIRDLLERIRIEGDEQDEEYQTRSHLYLGLILTNLIRLSKPKKEITRLKHEYYYRENLSDIVLRLISYIENNYKNDISSIKIEKALNYSYRFISRVTKSEIGLTPIEFLEHHRIALAKERLSTTNTPLKEIASEIGYPNIHHFSRSFSKIMGIPPGKYRENTFAGIRKDIIFSDNFINENRTIFS